VKGQVQPLTAVLVTTAIIGSVAAAFVLGTPLLEKRQAEEDFESTESQMIELYDAMLETASSGQGASEVVSPPSELGSIRVNDELDYIETTVPVTNPPYPAGTWSLVRGQRSRNLSFGAGDYGIQSRDSAAVLAAKPSSATQQTVVRYRAESRNMLVRTPSGRRLTRIDIQTSGQETASDPESIRIENLGEERDSGDGAVRISTGEQLDRTRTVLEVTFN
jgi:hypothetical protein